MSNHSLNYTKSWKKRDIELVTSEKANTLVVFENLDSEDYEEVTIIIQMKGESFEFSA